MYYKIQQGVGSSKYLLSFYTGKKHSDGSDFLDVRIFKNKKALKSFTDYLDDLRRDCFEELANIAGCQHYSECGNYD